MAAAVLAVALTLARAMHALSNAPPLFSSLEVFLCPRQEIVCRVIASIIRKRV